MVKTNKHKLLVDDGIETVVCSVAFHYWTIQWYYQATSDSDYHRLSLLKRPQKNRTETYCRWLLSVFFFFESFQSPFLYSLHVQLSPIWSNYRNLDWSYEQIRCWLHTQARSWKRLCQTPPDLLWAASPVHPQHPEPVTRRKRGMIRFLVLSFFLNCCPKYKRCWKTN